METRGVPVVVEGLVKHWPATTKWRNRAYLGRSHRDRTVPIEIGKEYTDDDWSQKLMTVRAFMDDYFSSDGSKTGDDPSARENIGYLAQHELFEQCRIAAADIDVPLYCALGGEHVRGQRVVRTGEHGITGTHGPAS